MVERNTALRNKHRREVRQGHGINPTGGPDPPCYWCLMAGLDEDAAAIDYTADHLDPLSFQIDHVTPLAKGGTDTLDNITASHRKCNRDKSDKLHPPMLGVTFVTDRCWWSEGAAAAGSGRGRR